MAGGGEGKAKRVGVVRKGRGGGSKSNEGYKEMNKQTKCRAKKMDPVSVCS